MIAPDGASRARFFAWLWMPYAGFGSSSFSITAHVRSASRASMVCAQSFYGDSPRGGACRELVVVRSIFPARLAVHAQSCARGKGAERSRFLRRARTLAQSVGARISSHDHGRSEERRGGKEGSAECG